MTDFASANPQKVSELFEQMTAGDSWLSSLGPPGAAFSRVRIYSLGVVIRLMILQRLLARFSLSCAVQHLARMQANVGAGLNAFRQRQEGIAGHDKNCPHW
jgi:hypothetical protein